MANPSKGYFPLLDLLRGPASLLVLFEHWRNLLFVDYVSIANPNLLLKIFYLLSGLGHEAVIVFFVLSGTVITHVINLMHIRGQWSWRKYLFDRISRLWIVLIPALMLTSFWDYLGISISSSTSRVYSGDSFGHIVNSPVLEQLSLGSFIGNLFFLQTSYSPTYGSNGPLWSIAYEFTYYLIFPLLLAGFIKAVRRDVSSIFYVGAAILIYMLTTDSIRYNFLIWSMGVFAYFLYTKLPLSQKASKVCFTTGSFTIFLFIIFSRLQFVDFRWDIIIGLATTFTLYAALSINSKPSSNKAISTLIFSSKISFSLYLLHTPLLVFISSCLFLDNNSRWQPDIYHLFLAFAILCATLTYVFFIWSFTEKRTFEIRTWIISKYSQFSS